MLEISSLPSKAISPTPSIAPDEQGDVRITADQIAQLEAIPYLGSRPIRVDIEGLGPFLVAESSVGSGGPYLGAACMSVSLATDVDQVAEEFIQREALYACVLSIESWRWLPRIFSRFVLCRGSRGLPIELPNGPHLRVRWPFQDRVHPVDPKSKSEADRLAMSFNRMLENVETSLQTRERAERSMQRFVAEASHELRNPLAASVGMPSTARTFRTCSQRL